MFAQAVTITASSGGPGTYTVTVGFTASSIAPFLRVNDRLTDRLGNQYNVDSWTGNPSDFVNFTDITVSYLTTDTAPATFLAVGDASIETPNQPQTIPEVQSLGTITGSSLNSGQDYEFNINASWLDASSGNVQVGDCIMDLSGKKFEVTEVTTPGLTTGKVREVDQAGQGPQNGQAVLFRPTPNFNFSQSLFLTNTSNLRTLNSDLVGIDGELVASSGNGDWQQITHTVSGPEASAKQFTITPTPVNDAEVVVQIQGGPPPTRGSAYTISGGVFSWNGLDLDGILDSGDVITLSYFS